MEKECSKKESIEVKFTFVPDPQKLELAFKFLVADFRNRFEFIKKNYDSTNKTITKKMAIKPPKI